MATLKSRSNTVAFAGNPFMAINSTEPLIYKPLGEAVEYCVAKGLDVGVTTGAYVLPARAEELAAAGLQRLNVSVDGPEETHNLIRGRKDSFGRSRDGIHKFREASQRLGLDNAITLNYTITNLNAHKLVEFYDEARDWPVDQINFTFMWFIDPDSAVEHNQLYGNRYPVTASCFGEDMDPYCVDVDDLAKQIEALKGKPRVEFAPPFKRDELKRYFHEPTKFVSAGAKCMATWFFLQVLADGNVIVYTRCHNKPLGNVNSQSINSIWQGEEMTAWREFIREQRTMPMCKRCDLAY